MFLVPSVLVTNSSTGAPYDAAYNTTQHPPICCQLQYKASLVLTTHADAIMSNPFYTFHRAESLQLASPLPTHVLTNEVIPPIEVRVMSKTDWVQDVFRVPNLMPLLHGPDLLLTIQLTISYANKVFALKPPSSNIHIEGMDVSPLLYSAVKMNGDSMAIMNYLDDRVIRLPIRLLPSGYYGAIFTGVSFDNVHPGFQLNFTLANPGGMPYYVDTVTRGMTQATPFSRAVIGFPEFERLMVSPPVNASGFGNTSYVNNNFGPR